MAGGFKGLFFKEDEKPKEEAPVVAESTEEVVEETAQAPNFNFNYQGGSDPVVGEGVYNEEIASQLMAGLEESKKNMAYFDFLKAKKAMDAMPMDEAVRFQSAFVALSTQGLTQEGLVTSIDEHMASLDGELEGFLGAIAEKRDAEITSREDEVERNNLIAQSKAEEIQKLTEEIQGIQEKNAELGEEIKVESASIDTNVANFEVTIGEVKKGFQGHRDQVDLYLSQGTKEETIDE
jgi:hypothetical protein